MTATWVGLGVLAFVILYFTLPSLPDLLGPLFTRKHRK